MNDDEIDSLIRLTQSKPEFPHSFQREVWARVTVAEQRSFSARWRQWSRVLFFWLARPAPAVATVAVMLGLGIGLGSLTSSARSENLRTVYVTSINPLKAAHTAMQE